MAKKILIIAGEASGDLLGADLMQELQKQFQDIEFIGVGGEKMLKAGLKPVFPMAEISLMGLAEVVPHIPKILKLIQKVADIAIAEQVDAVVTIDAQDFSKRVAKKIKQKQDVPCIHYVCPTVWAWRKGRAKKYAKLFDHILALFPFEPAYFEEYGGKCEYVGHPLGERMRHIVPQTLVRPEKPRIVLLPGSRRGEIERHWEDMKCIYTQLRQDFPEAEGLVLLPGESYVEMLGDVPAGIEVLYGEGRFDALKTCRVALTKSGTANLELGMAGVPMVVFYKMAPLTYNIAKLLVNVPYISPVNWVLGKKAVPEFIQEAFTADNVVPVLKSLLADESAWYEQAQNLQHMRALLTTENAAKQAADIVASYLS